MAAHPDHSTAMANPLLDLKLAQLSRRRLLQRFGLAATASCLPLLAPQAGFAQPLFLEYPFRLGVAAGDPAPDGFVIWTRLCPRPLDSEAHYGMPRQPVEVKWELARDRQMREIVQKGTAVAHPELGHSVHVELQGLEPARSYFYRFSAGRERSFVGHARTLPAPGAQVGKVRFGVAGCQHYEHGLYTAHAHLAKEELDFVYCYGDYIYEGRGSEVYPDWGTGEIRSGVRLHQGDEIYSLDDYRRRYAQYKMDANLLRAHAAHAWFPVWDDHEIDNNWAADIDQDGTPPELFRLRRAAAAQAYYEMMPLRKASFPIGAALQLNRRARWGDLLELNFLDTRSHRSDQPCGDKWERYPCAAVRDPQATMLGAQQERWLLDGLAASKARWNGLAQQVMVSDFSRDTQVERINLDSWAGYAIPRERLLGFIHERRLRNVVVLSGDEHQHYALDVKLKGGASDSPIVLTEFVGSSISSGGDGTDMGRGGQALWDRNPHCKLYNGQRGYLVCEVRPDAWQTDCMVLDQISRPGGQLSRRARFLVEPGRPGAQLA